MTTQNVFNGTMSLVSTEQWTEATCTYQVILYVCKITAAFRTKQDTIKRVKKFDGFIGKAKSYQAESNTRHHDIVL